MDSDLYRPGSCAEKAPISANVLRAQVWPSREAEKGARGREPGAADTISGMANRLADETSPYLLQHAHNPVDWYPWGPEALARARAENKPIFLSIGYAACHWCHVMERESFEDAATADDLNRDFVAVKVDREERPDLDQVYMAAVQAMTGQGGWPMSIFLTPDGKPFYGGTYFPPQPAHGMPAFRQVLAGVARAWRDEPLEVLAAGKRLVDALVQQQAGPANGDAPTRALLDTATAAIEASFDATNGGWGGAPKFPQPMTIEYLLRRAATTGDPRPLAVARRSLDAMADGGIHDQLGGGFHRYATDAIWLVPHFEQMLYDNAQLARVYTHAFAATGDGRYARRGDGHARLHGSRADDDRWRVRREPGRRHRGRRRQDLHLDRRRDPRRARRGRGRVHRRLRPQPMSGTGSTRTSCRGSFRRPATRPPRPGSRPRVRSC